MKKRKYNNILIIAIFAIYILYYRIFIATSGIQYADFINAAALVIIAFISILLLGFRRDKLTPKKKSILEITITEIVLFFCVSYGLGLITGFLKNTYSLDLLSILDNIFAPIIFIIAIEVFRYTVLNANRDNDIIIYLVTILITILELMISLDGALIYDFETTFKTISSIVIPIIIKNAVMSYLTIYGGLKSTLLYRLVMDIYTFVLPIIPDLGGYMNSVIGILLPTLVYMYTSRVVDMENSDQEEESKKSPISFADIPVLLFIIVLVGLISGHFKYSLIGIGSGSMSPKIEKGDAVLYMRVNKPSELKKGDILVFNSGSKIIVHRLVGVKKSENGETYFITKGDANNANDSFNLTFDNIRGKVLFKIKYLAYPNLFLKDMIDKE